MPLVRLGIKIRVATVTLWAGHTKATEDTFYLATNRDLVME